jgi:hypothetical protein
MIIRHAPLTCDECSDEIAATFHAILGGKVYRLCSESCRTTCRANYVKFQSQKPVESDALVAISGSVLPSMPCGAYGDEWG